MSGAAARWAVWAVWAAAAPAAVWSAEPVSSRLDGPNLRGGLTHDFRRPGSLLERAEAHPRLVDPSELRQRRIVQVTQRGFYTEALPGTAAAFEDVDLPDAPEAAPAVHAAAAEGAVPGLSTWHVGGFLLGVALALFAVCCFAGRKPAQKTRR
jgi:hypothetical protein